MKKNVFKILKLIGLSLFWITMWSCGKSGGYAPSADLPSLTTTAVVITPNAITVAALNTVSFSASGGIGSYSYSVFSGSGSVLSTTGSYTAPSAAGTAVVRVIDGQGQYADAIITINAALEISPSSQSLSLNATQAFTATGGVPPITFSLAGGSGTVDNTGLYTAPAIPGSATVRATDSYGNVADAAINIFGALGISPTSTTVAVNNTIAFSAGGGAAPYTYSIFSGGGVINASTGFFTAPGAAGSVIVRVTDSLGATANASITINPALQISPASQTMLINDNVTFSYAGGVDPVSFSVVSGGGTIDSNSGIYTAPGSNASVVLRVTDSMGNTSDANVTVTTTVTISPTTKILAVNNVFSFTGSGGTPPLSYSIFSGGGTINSSTGSYTAPGSSGSAVVRVTDSLGATADAAVTINAALAISPSVQTLSINGSITFSSSGGVVPYTYSIVSGSGTVDASTGIYTAPGSVGTDIVCVTDSLGNTANATITINNSLGINPAAVTLAVNNTTTFSGLSGSPPYSFSIVSGGGSVAPLTGFFTAPAGAGTVIVRVTDSLLNTANATVTVNTALAISPASKTLAVNNVFIFSATGGVSPYVYSIVAGGGSIDSATGQYTAPASSGSATVRVTDGYGNTSNATVTINNALAISTTTPIITVANTATFTSSGGVSPYTYSVFSGTGSINVDVYTPAGSGVITIRSTDSIGNTSDTSLTVNSTLTMTPTIAYVTLGSDYIFSYTGGVAPVTYTVVSGSGSFADTAVGAYTAGGANGVDTVRVTDALGNTSDATANVYTALSISPTIVTMGIGTNQTFTGAGGSGALTYSIVSGNGSIGASSGIYTAPGTAENGVVQVADTIGNTATANITVVSALTISPVNLKLPVFSTAQYSAILGTPAYTFSLLTTIGSSTINSASGVYSADGTLGSGTVKVTDSPLNTSTTSITHIKPVDVQVGQYFACALYSEGSVKCWGANNYGQLGVGSTATIGDAAAEIGGANQFVNLGTGRTATQIAVGLDHVCALLDNATVKCWGLNTNGQLGQNNTNNIGIAANDVANLAAVYLGSGRTASAVYAFGYVSCAKLDDASVKCWGQNTSGQVGIGNITGANASIGDAANEMQSLAAINFGAGRTATKVVGGLSHTCALLDNATVKCWGGASRGQTGQDNMTNLLSPTAVNIDGNSGSTKTALDLVAGYEYNCVKRNDSSMICWGRNSGGSLGIGATNGANAEIGDQAGEMALIAPINMNTGFGTLANIYATGRTTCAKDASNVFKCWGFNTEGQLVTGNTTIAKAPPAGAMNIGTGLVVSKMSSSYYTLCALFTNDRIKCWGRGTNASGAAHGIFTGSSSTNHLGDAATAGETGNSLPYINH